jgi:hypothetical protein
MTIHKGVAPIAVLIVVLSVLVIGGAGYVAFTPDVLPEPKETADDGVQTEPGDHREVDHDANEGMQADASIHWKFDDAGEREHIPYTRVSVQVGEEVYDMGEFQGSCSQVGATGGVDGKGLLAGELSAVQCWFAGGGDEIGVFAHEDGGYQIMVGTLEEPIEGSAGFRGDFEIKVDILP